MGETPSLLKQKWYCVESMHLPPNTPTYIIAGHWDPHVGPIVCDSFEPYLAVENEVFDTEEQAIAAANEVMNHICDLHNAALEGESS